MIGTMAGVDDPSARPEESREDQAGRDGGAESPIDERARAAAYLDLWERHVAQAAVHGSGISAPWFAR